MKRDQIFSWKFITTLVVIISIVGFLLCTVFDFGLKDELLLGGVIIGSVPLLIDIVKSVLERHFGVDLIALAAIGSSIVLGEYLAGAVILLMLSGGESFEAYALKSARKELEALISNAPKRANLKVGDKIKEINVEEVKVGDILIVRKGELVPVDGRIVNGTTSLDESRLTGESIPVEKGKHSEVMSGSINLFSMVEVKATKLSNESRYEQIIRLVKQAEASKAPFVRLADRYSVYFTTVAFTIALLAWAISGDPVRALAVLVVATPCPLILATPIAFASGVSKTAKRGIIIKNPMAIEKLAEAQTFVFDKTGTLTLGTPEVTKIIGIKAKKDFILKVAASLDQLSAHIIGSALVDKAKQERIELSFPSDFEEHFGEGVEGVIAGKRYLLGKAKFLKRHKVNISKSVDRLSDELKGEGFMQVFLADQDEVRGLIVLEDSVRSDTKNLFKDLRKLGISEVIMLTGDKIEVAARVSHEAGINDFRAEMLPDDKLRIVHELKEQGKKVVMVGDGINDAPAIAAADVGIAMGKEGSTASAEVSDVVIMVNKIERVGEAFGISKSVLAIAKQSIFIGIGLSTLLMFAAMFGWIVPVVGALMQEVIDVAVIMNALRVRVIAKTN